MGGTLYQVKKTWQFWHIKDRSYEEPWLTSFWRNIFFFFTMPLLYLKLNLLLQSILVCVHNCKVVSFRNCSLHQKDTSYWLSIEGEFFFFFFPPCHLLKFSLSNEQCISACNIICSKCAYAGSISNICIKIWSDQLMLLALQSLSRTKAYVHNDSKKRRTVILP